MQPAFPPSVPSLLLPAQLTPLVDRTDELATVRQRLADEGTRLLTLTGPAGVGKTRLALAAASQLVDHFPDGVTVVDLAPIRDPLSMLPAIARSIGLTDTGQPPLDERLHTFLRERAAVLLVLDNLEQLLPAAAPPLADLLADCPGLALLVTSRKPLQLRWEQALRLAPLPVPDLRVTLPPLDALLAVPSVELFVGRARARRSDFALSEKLAPLLAQLVAQLDGLPLALELAAARLDVLSLPTLARRLGDRLRLLASEAPDLPARQRSLEAAVSWSYDLLSEPERRLFRCLGVFVGRVTLDAITVVASGVASGVSEGSTVGAAGVGGAATDDRETRETWKPRENGRTLQRLLSLAEKSWVLPLPAHPEESGGQPGHDGEMEEPEDEDPEPAFGMLETVREYAWERLVAEGELVAAQRAHAYYFLALAEHAEPELRGRDQRAWFFRLEHEQDNLQAALRWLLDQDGPDAAAEREAGLRLAGALGWFWWARGYHAEGLRWLEEALAGAPAGVDPAVRARALLFAGTLLTLQGEVARPRAVLEEALALAERGRDPAAVLAALTELGRCAVIAGEVAEGTRRLREVLPRWEALGDPHGFGLASFYLGYAANVVGDYTGAAARYVDALGRFAAAGDAQHAGLVHCYLAVVVWRRGELSRAMEHIQMGLRTGVALRDRFILSYGAQVTVALVGDRAEPVARARLLGAADALAHATGATYIWELLPAAQDVAGLRERLAREGEEERELSAAYREGRSLPVGEVAALALHLLGKFAQVLPHPEMAPGSAETPERLPQPSQFPDRSSRSPLTAREQEVLRLVAEGRSSKAIGRQLFIAPSTVNYHLTSVFNKLAVDSRAQAIAVAVQRELL